MSVAHIKHFPEKVCKKKYPTLKKLHTDQKLTVRTQLNYPNHLMLYGTALIKQSAECTATGVTSGEMGNPSLYPMQFLSLFSVYHPGTLLPLVSQ